MVCGRLSGRKLMRALVFAATVVTVALTSSAFAQQGNMQARMNEMKAKDPQGFAACQTLATSRGYRLGQSDYEGQAAMMFIEGCLMGRGYR
jgi:hypothetical protein